MEERKFEHVMVDIETMGNRPYSAIVSIGAVEFDLETGETGRDFYLNVDLNSCMNAGLKMNADTVMWWMRQSEEARKGITEGYRYGLGEALNLFSRWIARGSLVWGNSARFDLGLLHDAYETEGMVAPWDFYNERCVRTLAAFAPEIKKNHIHEGIDHNALSDCYKQIGYCSRIWSQLKKPQGKAE